MAIVINSNISSLTAQRALGESQKMQQQAMERLSTGQRINSAADDAAGLAITNNFTSQIKGLSQAVRNANDAVSLAQTAEGGLDETTDILQRMRELAVQASSTTLTSADRSSIQKEITALTSEIDRIASTTQYNSSNILDGSANALSFQVGDKAGQTVGLSIADASSAGLDLNTSAAASGSLFGGLVTDMSGVAVDDILINGANWSATANGAAVTTVTNGVSLSTTLDMAVGGGDADDGAAEHIALAINSNTSNHGVTATARTVIDGVAGSGIETDFTIQVAGMGTVTIADSYGMQDLVDKINASTGSVTASINDAGGLRLVQEQGRLVTLANGGAGTVGLANAGYNGQISLSSSDGSAIEISVGTNTAASHADINAMGFDAGNFGGDVNGVATYSVTGKSVIGDQVLTGATGITINGHEIGSTPLGQTVISAADYAAAVNSISHLSGVTASARTEVTMTVGGMDSATVTAFDGTDGITINGTTITPADNRTLVGFTSDVNAAMRTVGNDIYATLNTGTNTVTLTSESGASITLLEVDADGSTNVITTVETGDGTDNDEAGASAGDIEPAAGHTFSGQLTFTSTNGPITFGHVNTGTTALRATAQTALNNLGVRLSDSVTATTTTSGVDLSSATNASAAITAIDTALSTLNTMRGSLGALQNRMEHTISSLSQTVENHSASRSRVMDADFAAESAALAKAQVLAQASTAMLAQANAAPQLALQLLQ